MEFCPYCQRWVEPKKGHADWIGGTLVGGPIGLAVGGVHHLAKNPRCPICNGQIMKNQQPPPQPNYQQHPPPPQYHATTPSQHMAGPTPSVPTHNCPTCGQTLTWSPQLQRWQCNYCRKTCDYFGVCSPAIDLLYYRRRPIAGESIRI